MIQQLDHLVILVDDLARAIDDYGSLGFTVAPGGEHSDGATHNALIAFRDGTYLELIAFRRRAPEHHWWHHTEHGEGLIDYALLPIDTAEVIQAAQQRGLHLEGPTNGGRMRPDGVELRWQTGLATSADLPFLCGDVTPRSLRVPGGSALVHPNGASGITALTVAVHDLDASRARYEALLGQPLASTNAAHNAAPSPLWQLGVTQIILAASTATDAGDPLIARRLTMRGEGPYAFVVLGDQGAERQLDIAQTHGVPIMLGGR